MPEKRGGMEANCRLPLLTVDTTQGEAAIVAHGSTLRESGVETANSASNSTATDGLNYGAKKTPTGRRVGPLPAWMHSGARGGLPPGEAPSMKGWRTLLVEEVWYMQVPSGGPEMISPPPHPLV